MKRLMTLIAFMALAVSAQETKPLKIGVFDSKRLVQEHWRYPQILEDLKKEKAVLDGQFRRKALAVQELGKARDQLIAAIKSPVLSPKAKKEKEEELKKVQREGNAAMTDLRATEKKFLRMMMDKEKVARRDLTKAILAEIENYGRRNGYTMIIDKAQGVAFAQDGIVITEKLLKQINAGKEPIVPEKEIPETKVAPVPEK